MQDLSEEISACAPCESVKHVYISQVGKVGLTGVKMRYRCPFCYYTISVDDMSRGYPVVCAGCGKTVQIPPGKFDPGCIIGDFVILNRIGAGSIGTVYKATQLSLDRQVALKILSPEYTTSKGIDDFLREARAAAKLSHTNLVQALAVGEEDGICYLAMTYVNGENLKTRLRREGRIPVDEALHIAQQVAEALYYAWDEAGLIHRDVKPDNIMTTDDGIVKLTDLGLAMNQSEWREGMEISGSPSYMSPEQFEGKKLDPRSDIYSLGVTLYQMISGRLPYDGETVKKIARQHMEEDPIPLRRLVPGVPLPVEALVKRMMAKKPENRFSSMEEVLKAIWTIRQKTAPNKSLVPDVHTISIKRLDYDIQNESSELKAKVTERMQTKNRLIDRLTTGFITALVVVIVMLMLYTIFDAGQQEPLRLYSKVAYFEKLSTDKSLDRKAVLEEGKKILDELPDLPAPEQVFNRTKMRLLISDLEQEIAANGNLALSQQLSSENKRAESLASQLEEARRKNGELQGKLDAMADYPALRQAKIRLTEQTEKQASDLRALNARYLRAEKTIEEWKAREKKRDETEIRLKILTLQSKGNFRNVDALVASEQVKKPYLYSWLAAKDTENSRYSKIYSILTDSGTRFSGYPISGFGRIEIITGGYIDYKTPLGELRRKRWREFPASSLARLLMNDSALKSRPASTRSACEFLLGRYGAACKADPANTELNATVDAYAGREIERLKYESAVDKSRTRGKVKALLELLRGSGNYANYEKELKPLL